MPDSFLAAALGKLRENIGDRLSWTVATSFIPLPALVYFVYNLYFHPLHSYPGPRLSGAMPFPYLKAILTGRLSYYCYDLHERYGDVVRIAPNQLSYVCSAAWKDIYERRPGHALLEKDPGFYQDPPNGVAGIVTVNHTEHPRIRRPFSYAFSEKALRDQQPLIKVYVDKLVELLRIPSGSGNAINIVEYYNWTTFDITGDLVFGESFGCQEQRGYHPWVSMLFGTIKLMAYYSCANAIPGVAQIVQLLLGQKLVSEGQKHMQYTVDKVKRRLERKTDRADFMTRVLEYNEEKGAEKDFKGMSSKEMDSTSSHIIIAGAETTATLLSGATYFLLKNPRVLEKLKKEIRDGFTNEEDIDYIKVRDLPYLQAVLDESLRLYPPVVAGLLRVTPSSGEVIAGKPVPGNTIVSVNNWAANHMQSNFRDPFSFVPERWLGDSRYENDNKKSTNPFSIGPRNCLGKNLAQAEMRLIMARIIYNFDIELQEDSKGWATEQKHYWIWEKPELHVKVYPAGKTAI